MLGFPRENESSCLGIVLVKAAASEWRRGRPQLSCRCERLKMMDFPLQKGNLAHEGVEATSPNSAPLDDSRRGP